MVYIAHRPCSGRCGRPVHATVRCVASITGDSGKSSFDPEDVRVARSMFAIARHRDGQAVGCGAFRPVDSTVAEFKRMYAKPRTQGVRGRDPGTPGGAGDRGGHETLWRTRHVNLRAVAFYGRHGYRPITNFGKYAGRPDVIYSDTTDAGERIALAFCTCKTAQDLNVLPTVGYGSADLLPSAPTREC